MIKRYLCLLVVFCFLLAVLTASAIAKDSMGRGVAGENMSCHGMLKEPVRKNPAPEEPENVKRGIDVSYWQGKIDWDAVAPQIDFAILRCGYGSNVEEQDDGAWHRNALACERLGIPYGVYLYSYATSEELAKSEAEHVLRLLEGHSPTLPIYLDLEDMGTTAHLSDEQILRQTEIFCQTIAGAGYTPGVYSSYSWWTTRLTAPEYDSWERWIAAWMDSAPDYDRDYRLWQYSSTGTVDGIAGRVDMNYWYGELPTPEIGEEPVDPPCEGGETCPSAAFADAPAFDSWAHPGVDYCVEKGLMRGTGKQSFQPELVMTRAQLVTILYRAAGSPEISFTGIFTDVPEGSWFAAPVEWAAAQGIVKGVGAGRFLPQGELTREQLATILYRSSGSPEVTGSLEAFPDRESVGAYARDAMIWATQGGLIHGMPTSGKICLCPLHTATRAQVASIMMRHLERTDEQTGETPPLSVFKVIFAATPSGWGREPLP